MPNELKPFRVFIPARGGGKILMAEATKKATIKRGEKVIVARNGTVNVYERQDG